MINFCPKCGTKLTGDPFCGNCGADLRRYLTDEPPVGEVSGGVEDLNALARAAVAEKQRQLAREEQEAELERVRKMLSVFEYDEHADGTYTITKVKDRTAPFITVPEKVVGIADGAFEGCDRLRKVILPEGLLDIGKNAFRGCVRLMEITMPTSLLTIDAGAFQGCSSLTEVFLPQGANPSIDKTAFDETCVCGHSREEIDKIRADREEEARRRAEEERKKREAARRRAEEERRSHYHIVNGVVTKYDGSEEHVVIPDGVTAIGDEAFSDYSGLKQITIPNSVTEIECTAFSDCSRLTEIKVDPKNQAYHVQGNCLIETKSKTLLWGCDTSEIPTDGSVTTIGKFAFEGCSSLTQITIPDSVTKIEYVAFKGCSSLKQITIPDSVTKIEYAAFKG